MAVYVTREKDGAEEKHPEQEPIDDQYRHLEKGIRVRVINMAAMTTRMDAFIT